MQENGAMMRREESEGNDLVEELGFSGTSRGTRKFEDCRCGIRKIGYFERVLEYLEELVYGLETCWRRSIGFRSTNGV